MPTRKATALNVARYRVDTAHHPEPSGNWYFGAHRLPVNSQIDHD